MAFLFNRKTKDVYFKNINPSSTSTSHERLLSLLGWNREDCIAGSIKADGDIEFRSASINMANTGKRDLSDTEEAEYVKDIILNGEVKSPDDVIIHYDKIIYDKIIYDKIIYNKIMIKL